MGLLLEVEVALSLVESVFEEAEARVELFVGLRAEDPPSDVLAEDHRDRPAAKARRMGVMYVIWDDEMYAAWRGFEPEPYLSSSCRKVTKCSKTLRHRDHVHISLTRQGGFGNTSWFEGRLDKKKH